MDAFRLESHDALKLCFNGLIVVNGENCPLIWLGVSDRKEKLFLKLLCIKRFSLLFGGLFMLCCGPDKR